MTKKIIIIVLLTFLTLGCKKEEKVSVIPEYDHDIKCVSNIEEENDGDVENYTSIIYIKLDDNKNVVSAIYQSISDSTVLDKATLDLTNQFLNIYKNIKGIDISSDKINDKIVVTIKYNYLDMDLLDTRKKLGSIVEDNNILKRVNQLPFSYDEYRKIELEGYECK